MRFHHGTHGNRNSADRIFEERKRRPNGLRNRISHTDEIRPETLVLARNKLMYSLPLAGAIC